MSSSDTILALASGGGLGSTAIIRVSGPACAEIAARLHPPISLDLQSEHTEPPERLPAACSSHILLDGPVPVRLPARVIISRGPRSYTGEDTLELLIAGGPAVVSRLTQTLLAHPHTRLAHAGEFSARAFLAGRLSLAQAEGIAATIAAATSDQLATARSLTSGQAGTSYAALADELATLLALVESGIDFADTEGVIAIPQPQLRDRLTALRAEISRLAGTIDRRTPTIALTGRPNAGKSTLFNALLTRSRSLVSDVRGTTRDAISEPITLHAPGRPPLAATLIDLAGLDADLTSPADHDAQARARTSIRSADVVLVCDPGDPRQPQAECDAHGQIVLVRTKADRPSAHRSDTTPDVAVCALTGSGIAQLRSIIAQRIWSGWRGGSGRSLLPHHQQALAASAAAIDHALATLRDDPEPALIAAGLRTALDELAPLTGDMSPDAILGRVFATFCIGK